MKNNWKLKFIAGFLILIMASQQRLWATGETALLPAPSTEQNLQTFGTVSRTLPLPENLPRKWGQVKTVYQGTRPQFLIHVQDAHLNYEAQQNIARILHYFSTQTGLTRIYLEGAAGRLSHRPLSVYPEARARKLVAETFLKEGLLTGPEFAAVVRHPEWTLQGVEHKAIYESNRQAFLRALEARKASEESLEKFSAQSKRAAAVFFAENLRQFFNRKEDFHKEAEELPDYADFLMEMAEKYALAGNFPQITKLLEIRRLESAGENPAELKKRITELGKDLTLGLFEEIQKLEKMIPLRLAETEDAKELAEIFGALEILRKIFDFSFSHEDALAFYENRERFDFMRLGRRLENLLEKKKLTVRELQQLPLARLNHNLKKFEAFYKIALERDEVLAANALADMENDHVSVAVLVTGGFHTSRLEKVLREKGISYCVITPRISKGPEAGEQARYEEAMQAKPTGLFNALRRVAANREAYANDTRFQVQVPSRLPTEALLETAASQPLPLPALAGRYPSLDFLIEGMVFMSATDMRLSNGPKLDRPEQIKRQLQPSEWAVAGKIYPWMHSQTTHLKQGGSAGTLLTDFSDAQGFALHMDWKPQAGKTDWLTPERAARLETSDGLTTTVHLLEDPALHAVAYRNLIRPEARATTKTGRNHHFAAPNVQAVQVETQVPAPAAPAKMETGEIEINIPKTPFKHAGIRERLLGIGLVDIPAMILGVALAGVSLPGIAAGLAALILARAGFAAAVLFHEAFHLQTLQKLTGLKALDWQTHLGNRTPAEILLSALPFQPLVMTAGVQLPIESSRIRYAGLTGSFFYLTAVAALVLASFAAAPVVSLFVSAFLPGAASALVQSFYSDYWSPAQACEYGCGNYGGVIVRDEHLEAGHDSLTLEEFFDLIEEMSRIEVIRGEQADGEASYLQNGRGLTHVRKRIVKTKRGQIPKAMRKAFDISVRNRMLTHFFVNPLSGRLKYPSIVIKHGHSRFGTTSRPAVVETQPHMGLPERRVTVWKLENGRYTAAKRNVALITSHNGDFDFWKLFGKFVSFEVLRDSWFPKVFGLKHTAVGDTPQLAQAMDFVYTQGMWDASIRYAYQFSVAQSVEDRAPNPKNLKEWGALFDRVFSGLVKSGAVQSPSGEFSKPVTKQNQSLALSLKQAIMTHPSLSQWIPADKADAFVEKTIEAFFENDLYRATQIVKEGADGSFGMIVTSTLEPSKVVAVASSQPMSFAFYPEYNLTLWSSEAAALKVPFKVKDQTKTMPYRFDFDQATGEIVELEIERGAKPKMRVYSEYQGRELTAQEVAETGRAIDMRDNDLIDPLPVFNWDNLVGQDISEIPQTLAKIQRAWRDKNSLNRQTAFELLRLIVEKDISKRIESGINRRRTPPEILRQIRRQTSELAALLLSMDITEMELEKRIRKIVKSHAEKIHAEEVAGRTYDVNDIAGNEAVDILITGFELSQWLGEQFGGDLHKLFPHLNIESVSSNKVLNSIKAANLKRNGGEFLIESTNRNVRVGRNTIVLAISQSGQTFGTLNATIALSNILPGRVFALTGGIDTLMGQAVGQVYAKGAPFSRRIFDNLSGFRPAEPSSISVAAAHATLTEILLYLGEETKKFYNERRRPLGMIYEKEDFEILRNIRNDVVAQSAPSITGYSTRGPQETLKSPVKDALLKVSKRWSQHILELGVISGFVALLVSSLVHFKIPFFPTQFSWFPRPSWVVPYVQDWIGDYSFAANMTGSAFDAVFLILLGAVYFLVFSYPFTLVLRVLQGRFPLGQRTGKRTITIGGLPFVHQILEIYVSKLFSLSYGFNSVDVHGGNPRDHFLARFAHRVVRGSLLLLFRPDGRLGSQAGNQSAVDMTKSQAEGIESFKVGAEVWSVGRNPRTKPSVAGGNVLLPELGTSLQIPHEAFVRKTAENLKLNEEQIKILQNRIENFASLYAGEPVYEAVQRISEDMQLSDGQFEIFEHDFYDFTERQAGLEKFYDTRYDALEGMIAAFVVFHAMARKVSRFFKWIGLWWDIAASQSRARIFTTRSPVAAAGVKYIINVMKRILGWEEEEVPLHENARVTSDDLAHIAEVMEELFEEEGVSNVQAPKPAAYIQPEELPFEVVTKQPAAASAPEAPAKPVRNAPAKPVVVVSSASLGEAEPVQAPASTISAPNPAASNGVTVTLEKKIVRRPVAAAVPAVAVIDSNEIPAAYRDILENSVQQLSGKYDALIAKITPQANGSLNLKTEVEKLQTLKTLLVSALRARQFKYLAEVTRALDEVEREKQLEIASRVEFRAVDLVQALKSKTDFQNQIRLEEEIPFEALEAQAAAEGWNLIQALKRFGTEQGRALKLPALPNGTGEVIFVYRPQDHDAAFLKEFFRTLSAQKQIRQVTFVRDIGVPEGDWKNFKVKVETYILRPGLKASFVEGSGSGVLHGLALSRLRALGISWQEVVQLPDLTGKRAEHRRFFHALTLGAVSIANSTLVILGNREALEQARVLNAYEIVETILRAEAEFAAAA